MSKKRKILAIGHSFVVALNRSVMREWDSHGDVEITVVSPRFFYGDQRPITVEPEPAGSHLRVVPVDVYFSKKIHLFFYNPWQLKKILKEGHFDEAYLWEEPYIVSGYQIARSLKKFSIPFCFFSAQNLVKKYPFPFSFFEKKVFESARSLAACGQLVEEVQRQKGFSKKAATIPLFVDLHRFKPLPEEEKRRQQNSKGLKPFVIGFMGRWTEEKGCSLLMRAIDSLPEEVAWNGLIMGQGPMRTQFQQWILQNDLESLVQLQHLKHDEVPEWLSLCDVLMCPSQTTHFWKEQFGRMLVEAFAAGVPVIASDSGEIPFVVGDAGIIVKEKDQEGWNQALLNLIQNPQLQKQLREKGLKRAKEFSAQAIAQRFANFMGE